MELAGVVSSEPGALLSLVRQFFGRELRVSLVPLAGPLPLDRLLERLSGLPFPAFLVSARAAADVGRFTIATADPLVQMAWRAGTWSIRMPDSHQQLHAPDPFQDLGKLFNEVHVEKPRDLSVPFVGGLIGWFGYELGTVIERHGRAAWDEFQVPDLVLALYDWAYVEDRVDGHACLVILTPSPPDGRRPDRLDWTNRVLFGSTRPPAPLVGLTEDQEEDRLAPGELASLHSTPFTTAGVYSDFSMQQYLAAVRKAIDYIRAGDVYQVNLSQRLITPLHRAPLDIFRTVCRVNPASYAAFLRHNGVQIVSCSPEQFLRLRGRCVETRPIKGTRPRWPWPEADLAARSDLATSPKDRAENVMIVDLLRNDLGRVCEYGSVRVTAPLEVHSYPFVHHLVSTVEGELKAGLGPFDLIRAAFPGGSVTGAPKVRAMEIIAELEPTVRGVYCGSIGYVSVDGNMELSIAIRTMTCARGWVQVPVGGGIVADSVPEAEYEETWHKARGMLGALSMGAEA